MLRVPFPFRSMIHGNKNSRWFNERMGVGKTPKEPTEQTHMPRLSRGILKKRNAQIYDRRALLLPSLPRPGAKGNSEAQKEERNHVLMQNVWRDDLQLPESNRNTEGTEILFVRLQHKRQNPPLTRTSTL